MSGDGSSSRAGEGELKSLVVGGAFLGVERAVDLLGRFVALFVFARIAPKDVYGTYTYLQSWFGALVFLSLPGLSTAVFRSSARGFDGDYLRGVLLRMKFSLIASAAFVGLSVYFGHAGRAEVSRGFALAAVLALPIYALSDYRSFLHGKRRFGLATLIASGLVLLRTALVVIGIAVGFGGAAIFGLNLMGQGVVLVAGLFVALGLRSNADRDPNFLSYGTILSGIAILGSLSYYADRLAVGSLLSMQDLADYGVAFLLTEPLRELGVVLNRLFFPRFAAEQRVARDMSYLRALALAALTFALLYYPVLLIYRFGVGWLFPRYADVLPLVKWLLVAAFAGVFVILLETYFLSQDRWLPFEYRYT
ncbi:MAG TPA: hypothetical protein ENF73_06120, partial [Proteobacteria bacterium]|nr:hypothetical protein [Pseudomonadota bacterium]